MRKLLAVLLIISVLVVACAPAKDTAPVVEETTPTAEATPETEISEDLSDVSLDEELGLGDLEDLDADLDFEI